MARVERIDDRLLSLSMPPLEQVEALSLTRSDCLIVCKGFEDRAEKVPDLLLSSKASQIPLLEIAYLPFLPKNDLSKLELLDRQKKIERYEIIYDRHDPQGIGEKVQEFLKRIDGQIYLDISAMSRLLIVQLVTAFGQSASTLSRLTILYTEAETYPPLKEGIDLSERASTYDTMYLSKGVFEVAIVPELSSVALQGQPIRLVAFPSFNVHQFSSLRAELQPSFISVVNGIPPSPSHAWRPDAISKLNEIQNISGAEVFDVSTLDYSETLSCLLRIYKSHGALERIVVSPTGSKMQAVAVGIFRTFMHDIQIAYPTPQQFAEPENYTTGAKSVYSLTLREFSELLESLD